MMIGGLSTSERRILAKLLREQIPLCRLVVRGSGDKAEKQVHRNQIRVASKVVKCLEGK